MIDPICRTRLRGVMFAIRGSRHSNLAISPYNKVMKHILVRQALRERSG